MVPSRRVMFCWNSQKCAGADRCPFARLIGPTVALRFNQSNDRPIIRVTELRDRCSGTDFHLQPIDRIQHLNRSPLLDEQIATALLPNIRQMCISTLRTTGKRHRATPGPDNAKSLLVAEGASVDRIGCHGIGIPLQIVTRSRLLIRK
jgi:hypothetical protein